MTISLMSQCWRTALVLELKYARRTPCFNGLDQLETAASAGERQMLYHAADRCRLRSIRLAEETCRNEQHEQPYKRTGRLSYRARPKLAIRSSADHTLKDQFCNPLGNEHSGRRNHVHEHNADYRRKDRRKDAAETRLPDYVEQIQHMQRV